MSRFCTTRDLRADLETAHARIAQLAKENQQYEESDEAMNAKIRSLSAHETCGCSYDYPNDICMHHSPRLVEALTRLAQLTKGPYSARKCRGTHWHVQCDGRDIMVSEGEHLSEEIARSAVDRKNAEWFLSGEEARQRLAALLTEVEGLPRLQVTMYRAIDGSEIKNGQALERSAVLSCISSAMTHQEKP
jgi:multidrug resistance efflux pump